MIEELGAVASSVYLIGNFFRIYIIGMFFRVFFHVAASRNRRIARSVCYVVYYVGNSMCFLVWALSPNMIMFSNVVGCLLVAATYIGAWKHRILAMIASVTTPVVCEDLALLKQQNQAYENQMVLSKESERNITALRHDIKNHLLSLQQLIGRQQYQEAGTYLGDLFMDLETKHRFAATGNTIVDGLLNIKLGQAAEMGVDILTDIQKHLLINSGLGETCLP